MRYLKAVAMSAVVVAAMLAPCAAWCDEPQVYFTRHFTIWYYTEDGFYALEDLLRKGPLVGLSGYGPESDFLAGRLEKLYDLTAASLKIFPQGQRLRTVLLDSRPDNDDIFNKKGMEVTEGAARYDLTTGTLYIYPGKAGLCDIAREFANAIMHADARPMSHAESRYFISDAAGHEVGRYFTKDNLFVDIIDDLMY